MLSALGSNGSGQLGIGHKEDVSVPKPALFHPEPPSSPISKVAAGGNHTLILTEDGQLWWSGNRESGACGVGPVPNIPAFLQVRLKKDGGEELGPVSYVAATWDASIVVTKDEQGRNTKIYSLGAGLKGELGLGPFIVRTHEATQIKDFPPPDTEIVDLAACMGHVVAVLSNGNAYGWGNCRKSQIGSPDEVVTEPRRIPGLDFKVAKAVCAKEATCLLGSPDSGKICIMGSDKWGLKSQAPQTVPLWKDVGASWGNFYILTQAGELLGWGRDDHGQLPPPNLPKLTKLAIGSEHAVVLAETGDVLTWGWGEHGNCGPSSETDIKGRWNLIASSKFIPKEYAVHSIGAGCATSWVYIAKS